MLKLSLVFKSGAMGGWSWQFWLHMWQPWCSFTKPDLLRIHSLNEIRLIGDTADSHHIQLHHMRCNLVILIILINPIVYYLASYVSGMNGLSQTKKNCTWEFEVGSKESFMQIFLRMFCLCSIVNCHLWWVFVSSWGLFVCIRIRDNSGRNELLPNDY